MILVNGLTGGRGNLWAPRPFPPGHVRADDALMSLQPDPPVMSLNPGCNVERIGHIGKNLIELYRIGPPVPIVTDKFGFLPEPNSTFTATEYPGVHCPSVVSEFWSAYSPSGSIEVCELRWRDPAASDRLWQPCVLT